MHSTAYNTCIRGCITHTCTQIPNRAHCPVVIMLGETLPLDQFHQDHQLLLCQRDDNATYTFQKFQCQIGYVGELATSLRERNAKWKKLLKRIAFS